MTSSSAEILRATIFHTPVSPFDYASALRIHEDGALLIEDGRIRACDDYSVVSSANPGVATADLRGGFLLPGFVDTHIHYPQIRILGGFGHTLLDWLDLLALPEEVRLSDPAYADELANEFVDALASHGTTTALVFGSHFPQATAALFQRAGERGLRIRSGLVLANRMLRPELHTTPDTAYRESRTLISQVQNSGLLSYAVSPRFALAASEPLLEVCRAVVTECPDVSFQTHINENALEVEEVQHSFTNSTDYFDVYEQFGLAGGRSVFAHNVHATDSELARFAGSGSSVAHCPCSNAALGSGVFPMKRHLHARVRFALGTDVGAGTGFGVVKEALHAYLQQRVAPESVSLTPAQLLYLATKAGAEVLNLANETGDFGPGKSADFVYVRPRKNSVLAVVVQHSSDPVQQLSAIFALTGGESIQQVRVAGRTVFARTQVSD